MSKFEKASMYGVEHVVGSIEKTIDPIAAQLSLENTVGKEDNNYQEAKRTINLSPLFFTDERGEKISYTEVRKKCISIALDLGYNKFTLA
jgi:hypothetical protein